MPWILLAVVSAFAVIHQPGIDRPADSLRSLENAPRDLLH